MNHLPNSSFLQSHPARIELARQRFFEEGQAPTGVVGPAVFESWSRCLRLHGSPREQATFQPVTASRTQLALLKNRHLRQAWTDELPRLETILSTTSCSAMLTDATGVLIGSSCVGRSHEALMPIATRLGVDLSEDAVGTTAPGVAARTGKPVCVLAGEHFFDSVKAMHCAAAPIRDIRGQLAGVFDLSSEQIPFAFDAAAVAGLFAGAIENRLLVAQSTEHLVIRFQVAAELLDSAMVGLIGIDTSGRLAWENGVARSLLGGVSNQDPRASTAMQESLGLGWAQLAALPTTGAAPLALPNGLHVWARAEMLAPDGRRGLVAHGSRATEVPVPSPAIAAHIEISPETVEAAEPPAVAPPAPAPKRLRESDLELIHSTLRDCGGNVSDAAQRLGVSRGLIYRRLRASRAASPEADS
ncbi:MAG TPA: helix-turn-helix domain-containing protein [Piscinibacter sp.]|jgi:transcriptional regulator of acetoin/glycerol metabolism|uniref:helix-turn-helix domain-containing protein n=1 Tax=Piscinibacter sp. TaxID=1903157 RepID=UPI001D7CC2EF|nr:helix-turn-helix domain-containing protein [Piscinibacter sp.]MBK7530003.1 Fis family transcriptional regulator [Piscinibacter sp.]HOY33837.1 helix-turn-helix domain-containing protein [Piscinibacter sp.]HPG78889.1 helix-turn-helix domain-containing protein [Piscinibacter sp.]HPM67503.1 helix-turn-helix domain-containing protein [Piscinibacter sp.]